MFRNVLIAAAASTALASAPLFAAPGGGHGPAGGGAGGNAGAHANAGGVGGGGSAGAALDARMNSMGPDHASPTGIEHANPNSVLGTNATTTAGTRTNSAGTTRTSGSAEMNRMFPGTKTSTSVKSGSLSGVSTGMKLTSNGTDVGTVQQIRTSADGTARVVVVQGTNGQMYAIPANKLNLANGTLTTTARLNGINGGTFTNPAAGVSQGPAHASANGIAHASSRSVLAAGAVASSALPGLSTGLTVQNTSGTTLGTVSQVVTDSSGNIRAVFVTSPTGQSYRLAPTTLTINGTTVVTTNTSIGG